MLTSFLAIMMWTYSPLWATVAVWVEARVPVRVQVWQRLGIAELFGGGCMVGHAKQEMGVFWHFIDETLIYLSKK